MTCPRIQKSFRASVNMRPESIRAWKSNPKAKIASFESTRARLPALADLKAKPNSQWTAKDCRFAQRVVNFNTRFDGMIRKHGPTEKMCAAERNWGRVNPRCRK